VVWTILRVGVLSLILVGTGLFAGERRSQWGWAYPVSLIERQRYGFVALSVGWRGSYDVELLNAGWYVDANPPLCAASPGGMDRALLIRVKHWPEWPGWAWLESMVEAHSGSLWLVGNEPDCIYQDDLLPEDYADIYYEIYWAIKGWDPTALVSPGAIVQPTPLRLAWLDRVLARYAEIAVPNGKEPLMPVDVWNIHNQILREYSYRCDPAQSWGADIPPGFDDCQGVWREIQDNDSIDIFTQQIWDFRAWMASRGYAGKPLIITEFGVLMPVEFGFDQERVNAFMDATFQFLAGTAHLELGDPMDGGRLVQRWAWFSLDEFPYDPILGAGFNGNLFDPYTTNITGYGLNFGGHTAPLPPLEYVELRPGELRYEPPEPVAPGEVVSRKVWAEVRNLGNLPAGPFTVRLTRSGTSEPLLRPVARLDAESSVWVEFNISGLTVGAYTIEVTVDVGEQVPEVTECDNELTGIMVVPADIVYLPVIARTH